MQTKMIPLVLMLLAGGITSVITYIFQYDMKKMLVILLFVLFGFYIIGLIIKKIIDMFEKQNSERIASEGEVIEKETSEQNNETANQEPFQKESSANINVETENTERDNG